MDVTLVRAAGGLVVREREGGEPEVVLVHRRAYDDWSFPKGKLFDGERDEDAALREVLEETGLECRLLRELPPTRYTDAKGRPKEVRYWEMDVVGGELEPANEIDAARWETVDAARSLLTYARDVALLDELERR
jgi:8-oxo-dGTP diphosphatase